MSTKKPNTAAAEAAPPPPETAAAPESHTDDAQLLAQSGAFERKYEREIQARVDAGLTREQAVDVQKAQVAHDLRRAKS